MLIERIPDVEVLNARPRSPAAIFLQFLAILELNPQC